MATANELLSTEACDDILVVDLESRSIIIPKTVTVLGVEADDETRVLHFRVPRYYCSVDLSEFAIRVNYRNAIGEPDLYIVTDTTVDGDTISFDWVVGRHAFVKKGTVKFSVCLKDVFEGIVTREFNTTIATLPVLEGLETGEAVVDLSYDAIEQIRDELFGVGDSAEQHIKDAENEALANLETAVTEYVAANQDVLKGEKGDTGETGPQGPQGEKGDKGDTGSYIRSIERTAGTGAPGTTDTYTITLTDGSTTTFNVYNGANGEGAGDMLAAIYDPQNKNTDIFAYVEEHGGVPSDWNENDPESKAYVKNRPFYSEYVPADIVTNEELTITRDGGYAQPSHRYVFVSGKVYFVTLNGETYTCTARGEFPVVLGNGVIGNFDDIDTGEPFSIDSYTYGYFYLNTSVAGTYTLSISTIDEIVHPIDNKYLTDIKIDFPQSNWNTSDSESPSYIRNRPFYTWYGYEAVQLTPDIRLFDIPFTCVDGYCNLSEVLGTDAVFGKAYEKYRIGFAWEDYETFANGLVGGDLQIRAKLKDGGVVDVRVNKSATPTYIEVYVYGADGNPEPGTVEHSITICESVENVETIPEKYLPDTVATKVDIEAAIGNAIGGSY